MNIYYGYFAFYKCDYNELHSIYCTLQLFYHHSTDWYYSTMAILLPHYSTMVILQIVYQLSAATTIVVHSTTVVLP